VASVLESRGFFTELSGDQGEGEKGNISQQKRMRRSVFLYRNIRGGGRRKTKGDTLRPTEEKGRTAIKRAALSILTERGGEKKEELTTWESRTSQGGGDRLLEASVRRTRKFGIVFLSQGHEERITPRTAELGGKGGAALQTGVKENFEPLDLKKTYAFEAENGKYENDVGSQRVIASSWELTACREHRLSQ